MCANVAQLAEQRFRKAWVVGLAGTRYTVQVDAPVLANITSNLNTWRHT